MRSCALSNAQHAGHKRVASRALLYALLQFARLPHALDHRAVGLRQLALPLPNTVHVLALPHAHGTAHYTLSAQNSRQLASCRASRAVVGGREKGGAGGGEWGGVGNSPKGEIEFFQRGEFNSS